MNGQPSTGVPQTAIPRYKSGRPGSRGAVSPYTACKGQGQYRPCRARPADRSLVAEDRSAAGVRDPTGPEELPRRIRGLPTRRWSPRTGLTLWTSWEPLPPRARWSFSSAVPPACHKQRSPAVSSGQSRSLHAGRWAGRTCLTWGGGGGRNCMVRKRSCRIGRLSLLTLDHSPGGCVDGRSHRNAVVGCIVWSTTASSSADRVSRSTCSRRRAPNASIVLAASYLRRLNRRSTTA